MPIQIRLIPTNILLCVAFIAANPGLRAFAQEESPTHIHVSTIAATDVRPSEIQLPESVAAAIESAMEGLWQSKAKQSWDLFVQAMDDAAVKITVNLPGGVGQSPMRFYVPEKEGLDQESLAEWLALKQPLEKTGDGYWILPIGDEVPVAEDPALIETSADRLKAFDSAKESVADAPLKISIVPPAHVRRTLDELMPELPSNLGGGPSRVLTKGLLWAGIGVDLKDLSVKAVIQSHDDSAAKQFAEYLPTMLRSILEGSSNSDQWLWSLLPPKAWSSTLSTWLDRLSIEVTGDQVHARLSSQINSPEGEALLSQLASSVGAPIQAHTKADRFKKIGLAIHNFDSANRVLPVAARYRDENGKPYLSWRVHILPYMGKDGVELWKKFALDEPWDSETNLPLLKEMPEVYSRYPIATLLPQGEQVGYTTFLAPQGPRSVLSNDKVIRFQNVEDGTSNTVFIVEVSPELSVPWTAPKDYVFDEADPKKGLQMDEGKFIAAMADGSVHRIDGTIDAQTLSNLFMMNDNNAIDWSQIHK